MIQEGVKEQVKMREQERSNKDVLRHAHVVVVDAE